MTDASPWARSLVRSLVACGLRHACICPGSRSTPLVLALHQHPDIHTPVLHDERTAAFLALGLARATRRPTAVVCTSGSAAAHLLPAITEAAADDLPLLLLTADRPPELHHCGAPQVMDQQRLFGTHVRAFHDPGPPWTPPAHSRTPSPDPLDHIADTARRAFRDALGTPHHRPGPVHLNLPFREPLSPPEPLPGPPQGPTRTSAHPPDLPTPPTRLTPPAPLTLAPPTLDEHGRDTLRAFVRTHRRPLLLAGPHAAPSPEDAAALVALAESRGAPILGDVLCGLHEGPFAEHPLLVPAAEITLHPNAFPDVDAVILAGRTPAARAPLLWRAARRHLPTLRIDPAGRDDDPLRLPALVAPVGPAALQDALADAKHPRAVPPSPAPTAERVNRALDEALDRGDLPLGGAVARLLVRALQDDDRLHVASSMPIRDVDTFGGTTPARARITANRGVNGIDGTFATTLGLRAGARHDNGTPRGHVFGLLGDVAALHDLGGLLACPEVDGPVTFVVVNNDGGAIFDLLPVARLEEPHRRFFLTPHGRSFDAVAPALGVRYTAVESAPAFAEALAAARKDRDGVRLIEVRVDREQDMAARREAVAALVAALGHPADTPPAP